MQWVGCEIISAGRNQMCIRDSIVHDLGRLAHRQNSDGVAVQIILSNLLHMLLSLIHI